MASAPPAESPSPIASPGGSSSSSRRRSSSHHSQGQGPGRGQGQGRFELDPSSSAPLDKILWSLQVPLHITHVSQPTTAPFITSVPRFGYLALLLPRLAAYYGVESPCSSFHYEGVQLRNLAVGLLVDLYQPSLPWKLTVGDGPEWDIGDTFMNSAKEVRCPTTPSLSSRIIPPIYPQIPHRTQPPELIYNHAPDELPTGALPRDNHGLTNQCEFTNRQKKTGRLHSQRQRQTNNEPKQGAHHPAVERRPGQRLRLLLQDQQAPPQHPHPHQEYPPEDLYPLHHDIRYDRHRRIIQGNPDPCPAPGPGIKRYTPDTGTSVKEYPPDLVPS